MHIAVFPDAGRSSTRCADPELVAALGPADRRCASRCSAEIEPLRKDKQIGSSLQAKVVLSATQAELALLEPYAARPADAVHRVGGRAAAAPTRRRRARRGGAVASTIERAGGVKCERCWRYVASGLDRSGLGRPLRALPGRAGRSRSMSRMTRVSNDALRGRAPSAASASPGVAAARDLAADRHRVVDQVTKAIVRATLPLHDSVTVIPGLLDFTHVRNTGAAFGILNAVDFPFKTVAHRRDRDGRAGRRRLLRGEPRAPSAGGPRSGLALIIGGAAGNLIDRVAAGSVVDFVDVYWRDVSFLGVQRRRLGDYGRRRDHDSRHAAGVGTHVSKTV